MAAISEISEISDYSYEEKKRIRKSFRKLLDMKPPPLLAIQTESYKKFLQVDDFFSQAPEVEKQVAGKDKKAKRKTKQKASEVAKGEETVAELKGVGLHAAFRSVFPIESFSGYARLEYVSYRLGAPLFNVKECKLRGITYAATLRVKVRLVIFDKESPAKDKKVQDIREQEVYMGEIPLMTDVGTFVVNGTERVVVSQLHRSPGVFFEHDKGKTHSSGKLLYSARVIPYRGSWLDFEFDPKDHLFARIDRRRKIPATILLRALNYSTEEILNLFFTTNQFHIKGEDYILDLIPEQLRGEIAFFDIKVPGKSGEVIVENGRRITMRHIRLMEKAKLKQLPVPAEYILGKSLANAIIDTETGEVIAEANAEITNKKEYGWVHNLGYIINCLINSSLQIEFLNEYPFVSWQMLPFLVEKEGGWWHLPEKFEKVPLMFTLKASKPLKSS